jgi:hypothetical protein
MKELIINFLKGMLRTKSQRNQKTTKPMLFA